MEEIKILKRIEVKEKDFFEIEEEKRNDLSIKEVRFRVFTIRKLYKEIKKVIIKSMKQTAKESIITPIILITYLLYKYHRWPY